MSVLTPSAAGQLPLQLLSEQVVGADRLLQSQAERADLLQVLDEGELLRRPPGARRRPPAEPQRRGQPVSGLQLRLEQLLL